MISINQDQCTGCGACVEICHEYRSTLKNNKLRIDERVCSGCTQCIAVCPHRVLLWDQCVPEPFHPEYFPSAKQLEELFKQRHTAHYFISEKPDRDLLNEIIQTGAYMRPHTVTIFG